MFFKSFELVSVGLIIQFYSKNTATTAPPTTTTQLPPTLAPDRLLYKNTANYHWPLFSDDATDIKGKKWNKPEGTGFGEGPFGFGSSIKLKDDQVNSLF